MVAVFHRDSDAAVIDALLEIRELLQSQSRDQTRARPPEALSPQRDHRGQVRGRLGGRRLRELRDHVQALGARPLRDLRRGPPSLLTSARARLLVVSLFNKANCLTRRGCHPPGTHDDLCNTAPAAMAITTTNRWVVVTDDVIARAQAAAPLVPGQSAPQPGTGPSRPHADVYGERRAVPATAFGCGIVHPKLAVILLLRTRVRVVSVWPTPRAQSLGENPQEKTFT